MNSDIDLKARNHEARVSKPLILNFFYDGADISFGGPGLGAPDQVNGVRNRFVFPIEMRPLRGSLCRSTSKQIALVQQLLYRYAFTGKVIRRISTENLNHDFDGPHLILQVSPELYMVCWWPEEAPAVEIDDYVSGVADLEISCNTYYINWACRTYPRAGFNELFQLWRTQTIYELPFDFQEPTQNSKSLKLERVQYTAPHSSGAWVVEAELAQSFDVFGLFAAVMEGTANQSQRDMFNNDIAYQHIANEE